MKELNELTLVELKALAYDLLASIQESERKLSIVNQEINKKTKEES